MIECGLDWEYIKAEIVVYVRVRYERVGLDSLEGDMVE